MARCCRSAAPPDPAARPLAARSRNRDLGRSGLAWAANTYFWIDPARNVAGVTLMQLLPFADKICLEAFAGFERGIYAGIGAGSGQKVA